MAGKGSRLRPHTLITPKPFISIAGKSILNRLLENLSQSIFSIKKIIFIIGNAEKKIENQLINIATKIGLDVSIYYQKEPLGTADALLKAKDDLKGPTIIAFSDTLFYNNHFEKINLDDNIIWTKRVKNPSLFGIVKYDSNTKSIIHFIEKPKNNLSNLAMIGIYYFNNSSFLKKELQSILDHNIKNEEEYQLTSALENMRKKGIRFTIHQVKEWMDFGNKKRTISSNSKILSIESNNRLELINKESIIKNSLIIKPCFIGKKTIVENSIIGPYVSIGKYTKIKNSKIEKSLIQDHVEITHANLFNSMIGNYVFYIGKAKEVNLGDYSQLKN